MQDPPILPSALAGTLAGAVRTVFGHMLLAGVALAWAALLTWSPTDPSFTRIGIENARNLAGLPGAYGADAALQSLGFAAFAGLLAPMFLSVSLILGEQQRRPMTRLLSYVVGVLALAVAFAWWRNLPGVPLSHGFGGIGGEMLLSATVAGLSPVLGELARPCAAILAGLVGVSTSLVACGCQLGNRRRTGAAHRARIEPRLADELVGKGACGENWSSAKPSRDDSDTRRWGPDPLEPREFAPLDRSQGPAGPSGGTYRNAARFGRYAAFEPIPDAGGDDRDFDAWTETSSSGMAARFAPASNGPHAMQHAVFAAFGLPNGEERRHVDGGRADRHPGHASLAGQRTRTERNVAAWRRPSLNLLARPLGTRHASAYAVSLDRGNGRLLADALAEFGIEGTLQGIEPGPVVTTYLFALARNTNFTRVIALAADIAQRLGVLGLRICERRGLAAIEWPNADRQPIVLRDCLDSEAWRSELDALPLALGVAATGAPIVADLAQLSGMLVSGAEASSRATGLNAMILSLIYRHGPEECRLLLIDPHMVDLPVYDGIPHLLTPVVGDPHKAITALAWCVKEMEERVRRMSFLGVRNIELFNNRVRNAAKRGERLQRTVQTGFDDATGAARVEKQDIDLTPMPYIVVVIEDLADLMVVAGREIEGSITRLAKAARSAGIHLIVATDRSTPDIVTTSIRDSLPARLSYRVNGRAEARGLHGEDGAEHLLPGGDSLFSSGTGGSIRVHGPMVSAEETSAVAASLRERGTPTFVLEIASPLHDADAIPPRRARPGAGFPGRSGNGRREDLAQVATSPVDRADELYERAIAVAVRDGGSSIAHLQASLKISAGWAADILSRLEAEGVVTPADHRGVHHTMPSSIRVA